MEADPRNPVVQWAQETLHDLGYRQPKTTGRAVGSQAEVLIFEPSGTSASGGLTVLKAVHGKTPSQVLRKEYKALEALNLALISVAGASSPEPLALHPDGNAYLMTHVPGRPVDSVYLRPHTRESMAQTLLDALAAYYQTTGELYGDLQPQNVLVDGNALCLIDPTLPAQIHRELASTMEFSPASADLAYWAYSVVSRAAGTFARTPAVAVRRSRFTEVLMGAAPARFGAPPRPFYEEIQHGVRVRLARLATAEGLKGRLIQSLGEALLESALKRAASKSRT